MKDELDAAVAAIRARTETTPAVGVVLGSGLGAFADALEDAVEIPYEDIPGWPAGDGRRPRGQARPRLLRRRAASPSCAAARTSTRASPREGRLRHPRARRCSASARSCSRTPSAPSTTASQPGQLVLISDHINLQGQSPLVGPNDESARAAFPGHVGRVRPGAARGGERQRLSGSASTSARASTPPGSARRSRHPPRSACCARSARTPSACPTVPEVLAARHMGIRCLAISCVTNLAAGISPEPIDHEQRARGRCARGRLARRALARARSYTFSVKLSELPSVDELLRDPRLARRRTGWPSRPPVPCSTARARRSAPARDPGELAELVSEEIAAAHALPACARPSTPRA